MIGESKESRALNIALHVPFNVSYMYSRGRRRNLESTWKVQTKLSLSQTLVAARHAASRPPGQAPKPRGGKVKPPCRVPLACLGACVQRPRA